MQLLYGPNAGQVNTSRFNLPEFNRLFEEAKRLPQSAERTLLFNRMTELVVAYTPWRVATHRIDDTLAHRWMRFFVPHPMVRKAYEGLQNWAIVVVGFTYVLGVANLLRINGRQVSRRERDWPYKIVLIAGLLVTMVVGFSEGNHYTDVDARFQWIYRTFYSPMTATMFSLLAFFIASASDR